MAWTYNEPTMWHEFVYDALKLCKEKGLFTVFVTNGFINEEPLRKLADVIDAINIDVKGFTGRVLPEDVQGPAATGPGHGGTGP